MTEPNPPQGPPYFGQPQPTFDQQPPGQPVYGQPVYGQPPAGQPQYGQPSYGPPTVGQPVYGQPAFGQPPYGQPAFGQPLPPAPPAGAMPTDPGKKSRLPMVVAAAVAVVALVAAGVVFANSRGWFAASGAATPNEAVEDVFHSLADGDLLGVAEQLAPSEAKLTADLAGDFLDQLKRLEIVDSSATPDQLYSLTVTVDGLTTSPTPIQINDHVQVVEVTGGTLSIDGSGAEEALTPKIRAAVPDWADVTPTHETFDIASQTAETGNALRIATVRVDGRWYPSVAYTIADNVAYTTVGPDYAARLSPIAATGSATPQQAMDRLVDAVRTGDAEQLVALLDPGTMGAVQDYTSLAFADPGSRCLWNGLLEASNSGSTPANGACQPLDVQVQEATWTVTAVTGGQKVSVGSLVLSTPEGTVTIDRDPSVPSLTITGPGAEPIVISPDDVPDFFAALSDTFGVDLSGESGQVADIAARELKQLLNLGVVMTQDTDGQWYVSPVHTYEDVVISLLRGLEPGDIDFFLQYGS